MDAESQTRLLLQGLLEAERDFDTTRDLYRAGEIDGTELDRRFDEIGRAAAAVQDALCAAADRLLADLPEGHAAVLRRYLDAYRVARGGDDGWLHHASERALEDAGVQLGSLLARALRARREPERIESEKHWAELDRERPARLRARLERTLRIIARHEPRGSSDEALGWCIYTLELDSISESVPTPLRGPIADAAPPSAPAGRPVSKLTRECAQRSRGSTPRCKASSAALERGRSTAPPPNAR